MYSAVREACTKTCRARFSVHLLGEEKSWGRKGAGGGKELGEERSWGRKGAGGGLNILFRVLCWKRCICM